jgi:RNA polymerase sigma-70 factor, ECF subfamily
MIDRLPARYRTPLRLSELEGLPQQQVARRLGLSLSGVKSRVQRGRRQLKLMLLDCCHIEFDRAGSPMDYHQKAGNCRGCR